MYVVFLYPEHVKACFLRNHTESTQTSRIYTRKRKTPDCNLKEIARCPSAFCDFMIPKYHSKDTFSSVFFPF
jgi:hypothetical protein